jgi:hypothetical protein
MIKPTKTAKELLPKGILRVLTPEQHAEVERMYAIHNGFTIAQSSGPLPWQIEPPGDNPPSPEFIEMLLNKTSRWKKDLLEKSLRDRRLAKILVFSAAGLACATAAAMVVIDLARR